jgi:hypothetical protein
MFPQLGQLVGPVIRQVIDSTIVDDFGVLQHHPLHLALLYQGLYPRVVDAVLYQQVVVRDLVSLTDAMIAVAALKKMDQARGRRIPDYFASSGEINGHRPGRGLADKYRRVLGCMESVYLTLPELRRHASVQ